MGILQLAVAGKNIRKVTILVWNLSTNDGILRASLLAQALQRLHLNVSIVGFTFGEGLYGATPQHLTIRHFPGKNFPAFWGPAKQVLDSLDGDLIYAIKPQPASYGVALLDKLRSRRPLLLDIDDWEMSWHGGENWRYQPSLRQLFRDLTTPQGALRQPYHPLYLQGMEKLITWADGITVHTRFLQEKFGGVLVPNGKDVQLFDPARYDAHQCRIAYGLAGYRVVMFPGAPRPYKGLEDLLQAIAKLDEPDIKLVIVGGSPYDDYDQQLIERWGAWIIQIPGRALEQMPAVIAAAHVVAVPQRDTLVTRAQFPLKLTDGMAMAKPVLATQVGDIPHILGNTGYLVDPGAPEQLAKQLRDIFKHPEAAEEMGKNARKRCCQFYSIEAMTVQLAQAIAQL